jgi:hypothetical protein
MPVLVWSLGFELFSNSSHERLWPLLTQNRLSLNHHENHLSGLVLVVPFELSLILSAFGHRSRSHLLSDGPESHLI